ncbi:MAG: hypothetical protein R3279_02975 [Putridiphycobacter sp.]|nr:hypothetical protein [Putridiphycobacter sp.]
MNAKQIYRADYGMKMLARNVVFVILIIISLTFFYAIPFILFGLMVFSVFQILFYRYSTIIVFENKLTYKLKNSLNVKSTFIELQFSEIEEIIFSKSEINLLVPKNSLLLELLFPPKENEVIVAFTNRQRKVLRWRGNVLEVQIACERANELIHANFNHPRF